MRQAVNSILKRGFSTYAALLMGKQVEESVKKQVIETEEFAAQARAHFPNPQRRPFNIGANGQVVNAPTPIIATNVEPLMKNGKPVTQKRYILTDPENPDSAKKLVTVPVMVHRGIDRKTLKKALYNDRRLAKKRWVN